MIHSAVRPSPLFKIAQDSFQARLAMGLAVGIFDDTCLVKKLHSMRIGRLKKTAVYFYTNIFMQCQQMSEKSLFDVHYTLKRQKFYFKDEDFFKI